MARRVGADPAQTMQQVLDAAHAILGEQGVAGLTLRSVAREAKLSMGTISYYFVDREALLEACLDEHHAWLSTAQTRAAAQLADGGSFEDVLEDVVRTAYRMLREDRESLRVRRLIALQRGELPVQRRVGSLSPALSLFAQAWGGKPETGRLIGQSVLFVVGRYCLLSDDELCELTGLKDVEAAARAVEDHVVWTARRLSASSLDAPKSLT